MDRRHRDAILQKYRDGQVFQETEMPVTERQHTAVCARCHDMFEVTIISRRGELAIEPSRTVGFVAERVAHNPRSCGGEVRIIGLEPSVVSRLRRPS